MKTINLHVLGEREGGGREGGRERGRERGKGRERKKLKITIIQYKRDTHLPPVFILHTFDQFIINHNQTNSNNNSKSK